MVEDRCDLVGVVVLALCFVFVGVTGVFLGFTVASQSWMRDCVTHGHHAAAKHVYSCSLEKLN